MGAANVPKFVRSLTLDFPVICLLFFRGNFSQQEEKSFTHNTVYFHAVTYPSRWPPKPVMTRVSAFLSIRAPFECVSFC